VAIISNAVTIADAGAFSASLGSLVHIKTITSNGSQTTMDLVHGSGGIVFDGTYSVYRFDWVDCHPSATDPSFEFQVGPASNTSYNQAIVSTFFQTQKMEDGTGAQDGLGYIGGYDQIGTGYQKLNGNIKNDNDGATTGSLFIFNPNSTTYVKHFMAQAISMENANPRVLTNPWIGGYVNVTAALRTISFRFSSGELDAATIKMYGIKSS